MNKQDLQKVIDLGEKATKGPWDVDRFPGAPPLLVAPNPGTAVVCTFRHERIESLPLETKEANAALIASYRTAAPEMARMILAIHDAFYISTPERFMDEVRSILDIETE